MSDRSAVLAHDFTIPVPGGALFARRWTPPNSNTRAPLILLHDSLGCVDLWGSFPEHLARTTSREVIAYDRLGYGRSPGRTEALAKDFIREEAERFFPALLRTFNLERFVVMGHSVGGGMAVTIGALHPGTCVAVISESAQALIEAKTVSGIVAARQSFTNPNQLARLTAVHGDKASSILTTWSDAWLALAPQDWCLTRNLPALECPLLVIHGDNDEFGSLESPSLLRAYAGSHGEVKILAGCGHIPHRERRAEVVEAITRFLATLD